MNEIDEVVERLRTYCLSTGKNIQLPSNLSEIIEVGHWVQGQDGIGKHFAAEANGWYDTNEFLPGDFTYHLEDDPDLFAAIVLALKEKEDDGK